jgi:hypothetical protein
MKKIVLISLLLCLETLYAQKSKPPFKMMDATSREWTAGARGGRYGTKYTIKLQIENPKDLEFKSLWLGKDKVPLAIEYYTGVPPQKLETGDSLMVVYNKIANDTTQIPDLRKPPIAYEGAGLIEYTVKGHAHYFTVKEFRIVKPLRGI